METTIVKTMRNLMQSCLLGAVSLLAFTSEGQTVTRIAAGGYHSLFVKSDGSLWVMGYNAYGGLGDGTYNNTNRPEQLAAGGITAIAGGIYHSLFVRSDGSLWSVGYNNYGELGDGVYNTVPPYYGTNLPQQVVSSNVTAAAAGDHSLFLESNGSLWAMGFNICGELGDGTLNGTDLPEQIVASNVTAIAAGYFTSLFLKSDGSLWAMGNDVYGQLGDGVFDNTPPPYGPDRPEQIVASNVTAIAAGYYHSLFLKSDGSLWAMGENNYGQLGDGTYDNTNAPEEIVASNVTAIAAGYLHSLFLKSNGSLWGMGYNYYGQLGDGTYGGPLNDQGIPERIVSSNVIAIAAGAEHSLFIKSDGSLWGMGGNGAGQLGDGTYGGAHSSTNRPEQIVAGVPPGFNQITVQLLSVGNVSLSFVGLPGANYALDLSTALAQHEWVPQVTNSPGPNGELVFTVTPDPTVNNFWRIRSVP